jgi:hypothetical protein
MKLNLKNAELPEEENSNPESKETYFLLLSFFVKSKRSEMTENDTRQTRPSSNRSAK